MKFYVIFKVLTVIDIPSLSVFINYPPNPFERINLFLSMKQIGDLEAIEISKFFWFQGKQAYEESESSFKDIKFTLWSRGFLFFDGIISIPAWLHKLIFTNENIINLKNYSIFKWWKESLWLLVNEFSPFEKSIHKDHQNRTRK